MTTFRSLAAESDLEVVDYIDEPSVRLVPGGSGGYRVESMTLRPRVLVSEKSAIDKALRLLDKAQRDCPVARSIGARVWVVPRIEGDVPQAVRRQMGVAVPGTSDPVTTSATSTS